MTQKRAMTTYHLRGLDPSNASDIERVNLMYLHPHVMKAKGYWEPHFLVKHELDLSYVIHDIFKVDDTLVKQSSGVLYGVVDTRNELVGWIWFYKDSRHPLPRSVAKQLGIRSRNATVFQTSYERLLSEGWPKKLLDKASYVKPRTLMSKRKGVIVSGLQMALRRLKVTNTRLTEGKKKLVIYAFTHPANVASEKVLLKNAFVKWSRQYSYFGVSHNLWVKVA